MNFFDTSGVAKSKKIGITSLLSNITQKPGSHKGGWTRLLKCQLKYLGYQQVTILSNKNSLDEFDVIIFDLGAEYSGTLNLFGGLDEKCWNRVLQLLHFKGELFSWRHQIPDLTTIIQSRWDNKSTHENFRKLELPDMDALQNQFAGIKVFHHVYPTPFLLIGDSHTPSVWTPIYMIERRDGRTLHGMLEKGTLQKYVRQFEDYGIKLNGIAVHCSSIDIRHHVDRVDQPEYYIAVMAEKLVREIATFGFTQVEISQTVGIEDESRELPKTGYFKGTPFYGSWEKRNLLRKIFNATVEQVGSEYGYEIIKYPRYFCDKSEKVRFGVMEVPGSVHTSPEHYRWDLDKNELRWTDEHNSKFEHKYATLDLIGNIEKDLYGQP